MKASRSFSVNLNIPSVPFGTTLLVCLYSLSFSSPVHSRPEEATTVPAPVSDDRIDDRPEPSQRLLNQRRDPSGGADTLSFGFVDEDGYAVAGETWTFDHGSEDPFEGWTFDDLTEQNRTFFRYITADIWTNGDPENGDVPTSNTVDPPILAGLGSAWVGAFQNEADDLCWTSGLGYGNVWCDRLQSPTFDHNGSATIEISFRYFNDTERDYDYTRTILQALPSGEEYELASFSGRMGTAPDHPVSPPVGDSLDIAFSSFGSDTQFRLIFEVDSDGGYSDEDGGFVCEYGPFAVDNVVLKNTGTEGATTASFDFETGLEGWTSSPCAGIGSLEAIAEVSTYLIEDPCVCELENNVLGFHNETNEHPRSQLVIARTPPVDIPSDVTGTLTGEGNLVILADWSQYSAQPLRRDIFYRPRWEYYPATCPVTGEAKWSDPVGPTEFIEAGPDPDCFEGRSIATNVGVPAGIEQIRFVYEVYATCDLGSFLDCEDDGYDSSFPPLIDNVQIRFTRTPDAPTLAFGPGTQFTDGFGQGAVLNPNVPGNADVVFDLNHANSGATVNGDSLFVSGPLPGPGTEYDARLWFRIAHKGPGTLPSYDAWRGRVEQSGGLDAADGVTNIEAGEFATVKMDTFQVGVNPTPQRYHSYFIEEDARFDTGTGEMSSENEIIADGVLLPGTQVEYFVSSNYVVSPDRYFLLPDTIGGFFSEFEILPRWRDDGSTLKFPCLLYVDAYNRGAQAPIQSALESLGLEFDRYDYGDANSTWKSPLARGQSAASTNGCTVFQLAGYRTILLNTGTFAGTDVMSPDDFTLFSDWLTSTACGTTDQMRGLLLNGDGIGGILDASGAAFLHGQLGATLLSDQYNSLGGSPDENFCVAIDEPGTGAFPASNSNGEYEYDAWGNGCPNTFSFDVLGTVGSGVGNRSYVNVGTGTETTYSQIALDGLKSGAQYRSVVDGVSWHHLSDRDEVENCSGDFSQVVTALRNEILSALEWIYGSGTIPDLCEADACDTSDLPGETETARVTRLAQNSPNPFHPMTTLRFSLAATGAAKLSIFDVSGREVKILVTGRQEAGAHEVTWDGTDDSGFTLPAGVYWSQLEAGGHQSNKKMVRLSR